LRYPLSDEPAGLGHDDRGLAATGRGDNEVAALVNHDRPALLFRKRAGLDPVEELARAGKFFDDERLVGLRPGIGRRFQKLQNIPQHSDFESIRQRFRPPRREPAGNCSSLGLKVEKCVGGKVSGGIGQFRQPVMHGPERFHLRRMRTEPPVASRSFKRVGKSVCIRSGQARDMLPPSGMDDLNTGIETPVHHIDHVYVAQRYVDATRTEQQPHPIGVNRCCSGMARMQDRKQDPGEAGPLGLKQGVRRCQTRSTLGSPGV